MILCLDYGDRHIGLAITDYEDKIALRYSTIDQKKEDALATIKNIVEKERVTTVLVGVPISLSGKESAQTRVSRQFIEKLQQALGDKIKIDEADETLTSVEAERHIRLEGGKSDESHAEAARIMLSDYLKRL